MRKNLRKAIVALAILAVILFIFIIGPEASDTILAANQTTESLTPEVVESPEIPTESAIAEESGPKDVNDEILKPAVEFRLKYTQYPLTYLYLLVQNHSVNIRKGPAATEPVLKEASPNEKLDYIETISQDGTWYHVSWTEKGQQYFGFVSADVVTRREFQFDKMYQSVRNAEKIAAEGPVTYIGNYHNLKGWAPRYQGKEMDPDGGRRSQSAPGYQNTANLGEFRYLGDGTLVRVLGSSGEFVKISTLQGGQEYYVPGKYVATPAAVTELKRAVVIDRGNQNEAVFEKSGTNWYVISYTLATTGTTGEYHQPTPLGYYYAMEKRERFYYYKDGTTKIQGYAPWAVRFAGGAYLHGVPVNYKFNAEGTRLDPGKIEYSKTLGTVPLSHKCVRNYTSHAKFLYDQYTPGEMIVIVIE